MNATFGASFTTTGTVSVILVELGFVDADFGVSRPK
jgi:hypothetical protein